MQYIQRDKLVHIEWSIFRGTSQVPEDFSRALVKMFLIGGNEKYLLTATAEGGKLLADLPGDLPEGAYSLEAIWVKNYGNLLPHRQPLTPGGEPVCPRRPGSHPNDPCFIHPHDNRFNDRCLMRSRKDYVFALTDYPSEETVTGESGEVTVRLASSVATYGYDGLSAYEIAVMRGDFSGTEGEFLAQSGFTKLKTINGESLIGEGNIEITGGGTLETATETKLGGICAATKTQDETVEVKIDPATGKLYVPKAEGEALEVATENKLGGIKAATKTSLETQEVKIDPVTGRLYTLPGGEGGTEIINNPDEEDLHSVEKSADVHVLQFADKEYNASAFSGLGRVYLRKNISSGKNILTQAMMSKANTRYIIQYDYDLDGETITVPENITLEFQGGGLRNGTLNGNKCLICSTSHVIFDNVTLTGTFVNSSFESIWFGVTEDKDCTAAFQTAVNNAYNTNVRKLLVNKGSYNISGTINIPSGFNFGGLRNDSTSVWKRSGEYPIISQNANEPILRIGDSVEGIRNISLHDLLLTVSENYEGSKDNLHGICGNGKTCSNNSFRNIWLYKCRFGMNFTVTDYGGIAQNVWENVAFTYNAIGFYLLGVNDSQNQKPWFNENTFRNCYINDNSVGGLLTVNTGSVQALLIQSCNIENNGNGCTEEDYVEYGCFGVSLSSYVGMTTIDNCYIEGNYPRNESGMLAMNNSKEGGIIISSGALHVTNCVVSKLRQFVLVTGSSSVILDNNDYYLTNIGNGTSDSLVRYTNMKTPKDLRLIVHEDKYQRGIITKAYEFGYSPLNSGNTFYSSYIDIESQAFEKEKYGNLSYDDNPTFYINASIGNSNYTGLSKTHPFGNIQHIVSYGLTRFKNVKSINIDLQSDTTLNQSIDTILVGRNISIEGNEHALSLSYAMTLIDSNICIKNCTVKLDSSTEYLSYLKCNGSCGVAFENCTISFDKNLIAYLVDGRENSNIVVSFNNCSFTRDQEYKKAYLATTREYCSMKVNLHSTRINLSNLLRNDSDFLLEDDLEYNNPLCSNIKRLEDTTKFAYSDKLGNYRNLDGTLWDKVVIL